MLNPDTPADAVRAMLPEVDLVLVMTVQPGFGGQAFRPAMLDKLTTLNAWRRDGAMTFRLEVDGGIDLVTGSSCRRAGADTFVAGTSFFSAADPRTYAQAVASWE